MILNDMKLEQVLGAGYVGKAITWFAVLFDWTITLPELMALVFITLPVGILTWMKVYEKWRNRK